jgi:hypothetical protein
MTHVGAPTVATPMASTAAGTPPSSGYAVPVPAPAVWPAASASAAARSVGRVENDAQRGGLIVGITLALARHFFKYAIDCASENNSEGGGDSNGGSSSGNPYWVLPNNHANSADSCTPNTLENRLCETQEPRPLEGIAIYYQPKKTASTTPAKGRHS